MPKPLEEQSAEELIKYITGSLRPENGALRKDLEEYEAVFGGMQAEHRGGFLRMLRVYNQDPKQGANLMRQFADIVNPLEEENPSMELSPEQIAQLLAQQAPAQPTAPAVSPEIAALTELVGTLTNEIKEMKEAQAKGIEATEQARLDALANQARQLGYQPGTPQWTQLWDFANTDTANGDVTKAHELMSQLNLAPQPVSPNQQSLPVEQQQQRTVSGHPPVAQGQGLAPSATEEQPVEDIPRTRRSMNAAAREYLEAALGAESGVPPVS